MLYVLEQEIVSCWESLKKSNYQDKSMLSELNEAVIDYNEYKKSIEE